MAEGPRIRHPGPVAQNRSTALPCHEVRRQAVLRGGVPLLDALTEATEGRAAWVDLRDLRAATLSFVMPAPAPGDGHAAWYSDTTTLAPAHILRAGVHLGKRDGRPFAHIHGIWTDAGGKEHMGHLLAQDTVLAENTTVELHLIDGAALDVAHDAETGFDIFRPVRTGEVEKPNAVLATIRPHEPVLDAIAQIATNAGITDYAVMGIGSLIGTMFEDRQPIESYATEILLTDGRKSGGSLSVTAASVGFDGRFERGPLAFGNMVCVTFEILIIRS